MADNHRRRCDQLRKDINYLQKQKTREVGKISEVRHKINHSQNSLKSAKSESRYRSILREIERYQKDGARAESEIAKIEGKITRKMDELSREEQRLLHEEERERQKRQRDHMRQTMKQEKYIKDLKRQVDKHQRLHNETQQVIASLQDLPEHINVLFLAANPRDQERLHLDEEIRAIDEMIRKSEHRDSVRLVSKWAIRPTDVLQALNEETPHVVHFSGHGSGEDEIIFLDNEGNTKPVSKDAIVQTMMAVSADIKLVFFNTCYSRSQAEAVVQHVDAAIGMNTTISDEAARIFSSQFYSAIGFGKSVKQAFNQAKALLMMEDIPEESTPELFIRGGLNADEVVIVKPTEM